MKSVKLFCALVLALLVGACSDDKYEGPTSKVAEGLPATLTMKLDVPAPTTIQSRALDNLLEGEVDELMLIMFENNSNRKEIIDLTGNLIDGTETDAEGARNYKLKEAVKTKSGDYRIYAFANWSSPYCGKTADQLKNMSEDELKTLTLDNQDNNIDFVGSVGYPMSRYIASKIIQSDEEKPEGNTLGLTLLRGTSVIEFKFYNNTNESDYTGTNLPNFTPLSISLYNIPKKAAGFQRLTGNSNIGTVETFNVLDLPVSTQETIEDKTCFTFTFHMLPSIQPQVSGITTQEQREAWTAAEGTDGSSFANRKFVNAPENAPFIVVTGDYSGPGIKDAGKYTADKYTGKVSYVIHLGNIDKDYTMKTDEANFWYPEGYAANYGNFTVRRNEKQNYEVIVNGVNNILVNVTNIEGSINQGVEGIIYDTNTIQLDAHYERVMLQIQPSSVYALQPGSTQEDELIVTSYTNGFVETRYKMSEIPDDLDIGWIQFQKPVGSSISNAVFPVYAGVNDDGTCAKVDGREWGNIKDLIADFKAYTANPSTYTPKYFLPILDNGVLNVVLTSAYIDENVYASHVPQKDWSGVTTPDRIMTLNPAKTWTSADEQSQFQQGSSFVIRQRSCVSPFKLESSDYTTYNPFGFEQVEEMTTYVPWSDATMKIYPSLVWDSSIAAENGTITQNNNNGYANTIQYFPAGISLTASGKEVAGIYWGKDGEYKFNPNGHEFKYLSQAIAYRNRDKNGDGQISTDEMVWYIPTMAQYYIYFFSNSQMNRLLWLSKSAQDVLGTSSDQSFPHYYTSNNGRHRCFWQDQRGATSQLAGWLIGSSAEYGQTVRFARSLGNFSGASTADITRMSVHTPATTTENGTIRFINENICRQFPYAGAYPFHNALDSENQLPLELEYLRVMIMIAPSDKSTYYPFTATTMYNSSDPEQSYKTLQALALHGYKKWDKIVNGADTTYTELPDGWRVPNQRETIALYINGVMDNLCASNYHWYQSGASAGNSTSTQTNTALSVSSCTSLNSSNYPNRKGFLLAYHNDAMTWEAQGNEGYMIFVRDKDWQSAADNETTAAAKLPRPKVRKLVRRVN